MIVRGRKSGKDDTHKGLRPMASSPRKQDLANAATPPQSDAVFADQRAHPPSAPDAPDEHTHARRVPHDRLRALEEVVRELSRLDSVDEICRRTIELGRSRLGFDRMSIWLIREDEGARMGMFGTDEEGRIRDELGVQRPFDPSYSAHRHVARTFVEEDQTLCDVHGFVVSEGMRVTAEMWHEGRFIGFLYTDNLIRKEPITPHDSELMELYAAGIGQLIVRCRHRDRA